MKARQTMSWLSICFALAVLLVPAADRALYGQNAVMGEIQFEGKSNVEKSSGVWIDGQYVGYLKELKGSKKIMLLPGEHVISVRQAGYKDFTQQIVVHPGDTQIVQVAMAKDTTNTMPSVTAEVKLSVNPSRAAVFLDERFIGHVGEFQGAGRALLVAPGEHRIKIALPGYKTFETDINPIANQKVEVKTELQKSDEPLTDPSLRPQ